VGVVLRFIYLFLVWESWDIGFWRRVFLDLFNCFWGKGGGLVLDLVFLLVWGGGGVKIWIYYI
jgi:hypothetical protein